MVYHWLKFKFANRCDVRHASRLFVVIIDFFYSVIVRKNLKQRPTLVHESISNITNSSLQESGRHRSTMFEVFHENSPIRILVYDLYIDRRFSIGSASTESVCWFDRWSNNFDGLYENDDGIEYSRSSSEECSWEISSLWQKNWTCTIFSSFFFTLPYFCFRSIAFVFSFVNQTNLFLFETKINF